MSDTVPIFSPGNDLTLRFNVRMRNATTGVDAPVTTGTITGFVANNNLSDAAAFDSTWNNITGTYVGGNAADDNDLVEGDWQFSLDGAAITSALFRAATANGETLYFFVVKTNGFRKCVRLRALEFKKADAA